VPDLPTISGGPSQTGSNAAASTGISIAAHASTHTKNATWTEIIAATAYEANWLLVTIGNSAAAACGYLVDIGVGGSTAELAVLPDLYHFNVSATLPHLTTYLFPIRVPRATRISARCQAVTGAAAVLVTVTAIATPIDAPPGLARVEAIGETSGSTRGTSINAGAVAHTDVVGQLTATTAHAYRWMCVAAANPSDVTWAAGFTTFLVDIVTGGAGSEVLVMGDLWFGGSAADDRVNPGAVCFPCAIAAGARVAARVRSSSTTSSDRILDVIAYGVG
jgi:hypothetical protein